MSLYRSPFLYWQFCLLVVFFFKKMGILCEAANQLYAVCLNEHTFKVQKKIELLLNDTKYEQRKSPRTVNIGYYYS